MPNENLNFEYLRFKVMKGWERQGIPNIPAYEQRREYELRVVSNMGFCDYFLIIADIVNWAKDNGIPAGPGRGSGAGSLLCYALGITTLDPIRHDLMFERFLNPGRMEMPDHTCGILDAESFVCSIDMIMNPFAPDELPVEMVAQDRSEWQYAAMSEWSACPDIVRKYVMAVHEMLMAGEHAVPTVGNSSLLYAIGASSNAPCGPLKQRPGGGVPDLDLDFSPHGRKRIVEHMVEKYGGERVAHIISFGMMWPRKAVRDVFKAMKVVSHVSEGDRVAKMFPSTQHDFEAAVEDSEELAAEVKRYPKEMDIVKRTCGQPRNPSIHPAGVIITPEPLLDYFPLYYGTKSKRQEGACITQWDMYDMDDAGFLKVDILGLKTLDVIAESSRMSGGVDPESIDLNDKGAMTIFNTGRTTGLFQLERRYVQEFCRKMGVSEFGDVVALNAIIRPGTMDSGMTTEFIERKNGLKQVEYPHPCLEPILKDTYGIFVYQEQIMKAVTVMGGFTVSEADVLRKAAGKKQPEKMAALKVKFIDGACSKGYDREEAGKVFEQIETFARYGFNLSHSASYAKISVQTAYFKYHYPVQFMCALLNGELDAGEPKVGMYVEEARRMGIDVLPPSVLDGDARCTIVDSSPLNPSIRLGLSFVKGVGTEAANMAVSLGRHKNFCRFLAAASSQVLRANAVRAMIDCGAFDHWGETRATLLKRFDMVASSMKKYKSQQKRAGLGVKVRKFLSIKEVEDAEMAIKDVKDLNGLEGLVAREYAMCGAYITYSPLLPHMQRLRKLNPVPIADVIEDDFAMGMFYMAGLITEKREHEIKRGKSKGRLMCFVQMSDGSHQAECVMFPEYYAKFGHHIEDGAVCVIQGEKRDESVSIVKARRLDNPASSGAPIGAFKGDYKWLSNFYPVEIEMDGLTYPTVENAFQALKVPPSERWRFTDCSPSEAKQMGREVELPAGWDDNGGAAKLELMTNLLRVKFKPGSELAEKLFSTGIAKLEEGNTWDDTFWGVCGGRGDNHLGKILMMIRKELATAVAHGGDDG